MARFWRAAGMLTALFGCHTEVVTPVVVTKVTVEPGQAIVLPGDSLQFTATVFDELGQSFAQAVVVWSSGAPQVVSVETDGVASALAPGFTLVRASFNGVSGSATVTVMPTPACAGPSERHKDRRDDDDDNRDDDETDSQCASPN
jgi:hypothetical protein